MHYRCVEVCRGFVIATSSLIAQISTNCLSQTSRALNSVSILPRNRRTLREERLEVLRFVGTRQRSQRRISRGVFFLSRCVTGQAKTDDVEVFNIPRKQAASTSGTNFELAETYSYEEFASRVVPRRALRHLTASRSPRAFPEPYCPAPVLGETLLIN